MVEQELPPAEDRPLVTATMFGVTTPCVTRVREGVPYGNAVLTRFSIRGSREFDLTKPPREPRGGIWLDIPVGSPLNPVMLHLFNVHFGLKISERAHQVEALVRRHIGPFRRRFRGGRQTRARAAGPPP